jgi:hypothetical protein
MPPKPPVGHVRRALRTVQSWCGPRNIMKKMSKKFLFFLIFNFNLFFLLFFSEIFFIKFYYISPLHHHGVHQLGGKLEPDVQVDGGAMRAAHGHRLLRGKFV